MKKKPSDRLKSLTRTAVIAAIYAILTLLWPLSFGAVQLRLSEALCVLPLFTPCAAAGLGVGCVLGGMLGGEMWLDVCVGSLTTYFAARLTRRLRHTRFALLPPVLMNAVITGSVVHFVYAGNPSLRLLPVTMLSVGAGEAAAVYALGGCLRIALMRLPKYRRHFFEA